ncbi:MAG: hypothetical protein ACJ798_07975 [Phenylobacterium sp.]
MPTGAVVLDGFVVVSPGAGVFTGGVADGAAEELVVPAPETEGGVLLAAPVAPVELVVELEDVALELGVLELELVSAPALLTAAVLAEAPVEALLDASELPDHQSFFARCEGEAFRYDASSV